MDTVIIVAVVLVSAGILISLILWLRRPGPRNTEYVTVTELLARLQDEDDAPANSGEPRTAAAANGTAAPGTDTDRGSAHTTGGSAQQTTDDSTEPTTGTGPTTDSGSRPIDNHTEQVTESGAGHETGSGARDATGSGAANGNTPSAEPADASAEQPPDRDS